jgi:hypothetical protein
MTSPAIQDAYMIIRYFKRMCDSWDIDEDDTVNNYTYDELGLYNYYSCLLDKAQNYLWNISPAYREVYNGGEYDTVMVVF